MKPANSALPPLSIGYLSPGWPVDAFPNGIVSSIATLTDQLRTTGHRVTIVTTSVAGSKTDASIYDTQEVHAARTLAQRVIDGVGYRLAPRGAASHQTRRTLVTTIRRAVAEQNIQLFEMEESFGWASWVRQATSIPVCIRLHGPWFVNGLALGAAQDEAFYYRVRNEGLAIALADVVTAPSRDVLERTRAYYGFPLSEAKVLPLPTSPTPLSARWRLEDCNQNLVLFIGRFDRHKGGDLIIEAFQHVLQEIPQAQLCFVGPDRGLTDNHGRQWNLEAFLHDRLPGELKPGQVRLLGQQPLSALASLRRQAMVTVICSRYENAPLSLTEAMSLGCPIVAARVGGIPESLQDQVDGLLHNPEDTRDLAAKIISMLRDPARAAQLGRQAAITCEQRFYPEVVAARMIDFYRRVLARWNAIKPR
jgi:glycosyltransferase involved in cell wall biosynthesis